MPDHNAPIPEGSVGTANIKVVGVGGGGQNAVNRMYRERVPKVEYISVNTDSQALDASSVPVRLRVGDQTARGLGVGGDPAKGRQCHEEDRDEIREVLKDADLVFVAAGMGGGTGTGGAPVVAEVARSLGALTVGVVTKPFAFEGAVRKKKAIEGIEQLRNVVDTLIVIPNDRLIAVSDEQVTMDRAFKMADDVLRQGIQSIAELILVPGEINLDFADVRAVMDNAGPAWMAIGKGSGENRAAHAAEEAINSPLLEVEITGAKGVIFNITGGTDLTLDEVQRASEVIASTVHPDANIIFGTVTDPKMENEVQVTIIASGFPVIGDFEADAESAARQALEDPGSMAIPPFLRHHPVARTRYKNGGMYRDSSETQKNETPVMADD
ncbi:MAG: cell division protein FtsZ [SAR202 cluster bacterium]|nr:cell division protein FtsZ [SAR202 cluster bacterium]|tara:strand:- start:315 stop:1463 length:1149 start_codon:yes stop_codon:yes gene_type:complete